jgi:hypothetical protein
MYARSNKVPARDNGSEDDEAEAASGSDDEQNGDSEPELDVSAPPPAKKGKKGTLARAGVNMCNKKICDCLILLGMLGCCPLWCPSIF